MADGCVVTILIVDFSIPLCLLIDQQEFGGKHTPEDKKYPLYWRITLTRKLTWGALHDRRVMLYSWTTYHVMRIQLIQAKQAKPYSVDLYLNLYKYKPGCTSTLLSRCE